MEERGGVSVIDDAPPLVAMEERMKGKRGKSGKSRERLKRVRNEVPFPNEENEFLRLRISHL